MGAVEGLQKRKVLLEVTLLDEDDLTDEKVAHEVWKALTKASRAMYPELEVKVLGRVTRAQRFVHGYATDAKPVWCHSDLSHHR